MLAHGCDIACTPAVIDPQVAPDFPAQLLRLLQKGAKSRLSFGIVCGQRHQHANTSHPLGLLRPRRERPRRRCATKQRYELAPSDHSITSSARASNVGGTSRPSTFAVVKLMSRSNLVGCSTGMSPGFAPRRTLSTSSAGEQRRRHLEAERLGGRDVDYQFVLGRSLDWQIAGLFAFEDAARINSEFAEHVFNHRCIAN